MQKASYTEPKAELILLSADIITYSETEEWFGPGIDAVTEPKIEIGN